MRSSEGISGWSDIGGRRFAVTRQVLESDAARCITGASVWDAEPLWEKLHAASRDAGLNGLAALSAVDIALWDLRGKIAGLPVHKLLGGPARQRMAACATLACDGSHVEQAAKRASQMAAAGYRWLRLAVTARDLPLNTSADPAIRIAAAVRAAAGAGMQLIVNLGGAYLPTRAVEVGRRLHGEFGVRYIEDPVSLDHLRELAQVSEGIDALVCAGGAGCTRWAARDLIEHGKVDVIASAIALAGGITEANKIAALAQSLSKPLMPRAPHGPLAAAAALHVAASVLTAGPAVDWPAAALGGVYSGVPEMQDGFVRVSQAPGLGVTVNLDRLGKESGA